MRLFIAVNLPDGEKERLYRETAMLRAGGLPVRWVAPESLHITLSFLGEVAERDAEGVRAVLTRVAANGSPFRLALHGIGAFPNLKRPRVIWVGAEPAPELIGVQDELATQLAELGFRREERPFSPHLTLGRSTSQRSADFAGFEALAARIRYRAEIDIATVDLMQSRLHAKGAQYTRLFAAPLGVGTPAA